MKKINLILIALAGLFALTTSACDNKGCTDPYAIDYDMDATKDGECTYPNMTLMLKQKVGDQDLTLDEVYNINGYDVKVTLSQFYMSGFRYEDMDGSSYAAEKDGEPVYILATPETQMYDLGTMRAGHLHMLRFDVGVDSATNNQDEIGFAQWPNGHPLGPQAPSMVWSWQTGYIFLKIEGSADLDGNGTYEENLVYHVGLNELLMNISLMAHTDIDEADEQVMVTYDVAKALDGIDFSDEDSRITHTMGSPEIRALAEKVAQNVETAFSIGH